MSDNEPSRLTKLEEASMHQQQMLQELNQVIIDLRAQLDAVAAKCNLVANRIEAVEESASIIDDRPEKPPHY